MNRHLRHQNYVTVPSTRQNPRENIQSCVSYRVCFGMRGVVLGKSCDVKIVQNTWGVFHVEGIENGSEAEMKECIYLSSCDFLVQLVRYDNCDSHPGLSWLTNTKGTSLHPAQPLGTS
jgi:hypothetical protein